MMIYPRYILAKRCLGGCGNDALQNMLHQCRPMAIKRRRIMRSQLMIKNGRTKMIRRYVMVDEHDQCECPCKSNVINFLSSIIDTPIKELTIDNVYDIPPNANCEPEIRTINIAKLLQRNVSSILENIQNEPKSRSTLNSIAISQGDLYFPHCIRLPQCGGCCPSPRLRCEPITIVKQNISVCN
ncbi:hypothetical protein BLOT_012892, partial [Blomia tropicalis]